MGTAKNVALSIASIVAVLLIAASCSVFTTFGTWPWTLTDSVRAGSHRGFNIGATKREALVAVVESQTRGETVQLSIREAQPGTYAEQYRGNPARPQDLPRVQTSDWWHLTVRGCNCWLELEFRDGRLVVIRDKQYRGPTE